ncbi:MULTISPECIES: serine hydrolase domain-containing protein [unclassified Bradyrhizobium]|uniref:serine hydrolase domain-containing protein n=1 Tax=unclassified Bradyrhizobium TaxID=2631580 RepID=UPI002FF3A121
MRLRLDLLVLLAATLGLATTSTARSESPDETARVDQLFQQWDKPNSPGCAVAVMKDGRIVHKRGYGMADLDRGEKITPATVFHVGSISKQFTAAAVLVLEHEGKLSRDDAVKTYVPELPDFGVKITLRHLLHHTSGLRDQWELLTLAGWRPSDLITDQDVLTIMSRQRTLNFPPGSEFLYSNTGFTLLAQVVKRVSGRTFRSFTTERVFQPLVMKHTHFRDDHAEIVENIAYGYRQKGSRFDLNVPNFDTVGATSLLTTVEDLALWDENFYTARVGGEAIIKELQEPRRLDDGTAIDYAAGLVVTRYRGLKIAEHAGEDAGYKAAMMRFPGQHFSVATLCNLASINPGALNRKIADIYLAPELASADAADGDFTTLPQPGPDRLAALAGVYVDPDDIRVLRLHVEDGKLWGGGLNGKGYELRAISDTRFRYVVFQTELSFRPDEAGTPSGFTARTKAGKSFHFSRAAAYQPTVAQLEGFTGMFRSDEIDLPYEVIIKDGHLVVRSKAADLPLLPVTTDLFVNGQNRIRFTRNDQGHVSGALLSTLRIRNFRFERLAR